MIRYMSIIMPFIFQFMQSYSELYACFVIHLFIFSITYLFLFCLQMSELLNQKSSIQGKIPSGYLNSIFDLSGAWLNDAADTKCLAFDGYFISLYYLHLTASPLVLQEKVKKSVPSHWNPALLSR